jgi:hypothetical protein
MLSHSDFKKKSLLVNFNDNVKSLRLNKNLKFNNDNETGLIELHGEVCHKPSMYTLSDMLLLISSLLYTRYMV